MSTQKDLLNEINRLSAGHARNAAFGKFLGEKASGATKVLSSLSPKPTMKDKVSRMLAWFKK